MLKECYQNVALYFIRLYFVQMLFIEVNNVIREKLHEFKI